MCPALDLHTSGANWSPGITGYSTTTSVQSQLTQRGTRQLRPLPTSGLAKLVTAFRHRNIRIHVIYTYLLQEAWVRRIHRDCVPRCSTPQKHRQGSGCSESGRIGWQIAALLTEEVKRLLHTASLDPSRFSGSSRIGVEKSHRDKT